jgi:hypothetical protein
MSAPPPGRPIPPPSLNPQTVELIRASPEIAAIDRIMGTLQNFYPRLLFVASDYAGPDAPVTTPTIDPVGWVRGKSTSPGGAPLTDVAASDTLVSGSYFIGAPEVYLNSPPPQRVVWEPPAEGEESMIPADATGPAYDTLPQPVSGGPVNPWPWEPYIGAPTPGNPTGYTQMGGAEIPVVFGNWLMPWRAHVWGSDFGDTRQLVLALQGAVQLVFGGCTGLSNSWATPVGGWATDVKGSRGLHYVLTVNIVIPVVIPVLQRSVDSVGATERIDEPWKEGG